MSDPIPLWSSIFFAKQPSWTNRRADRSSTLPRPTASKPSPASLTTPTDSAFVPSSSSLTNQPGNTRTPRSDISPRPAWRQDLNARTLGRTLYAEAAEKSEDFPMHEKRTDSIRMSAARLIKRRVIVLGSPSVGKTSLIQQYVALPSYTMSYFPTIEAIEHEHVSFEGVDYECKIIDTAGQEEYTIMPSRYAVGVHGYVLVYSINSRLSFEMLKKVHFKLLDFAGQEKVVCVVVGQKCDLESERRVTSAEGEALAKKLGAAFVESSAKENRNVSEAFEMLLRRMQKEYNPKPEKSTSWWGWGWGWGR